MAENGRHVGGHEVFVVADANHHGRAERAATILLGSEREMTASANTPAISLTARAHGVLQVPVEVFLDEVGDDLGVGFGLEDVAFGLNCCFSGR